MIQTRVTWHEHRTRAMLKVIKAKQEGVLHFLQFLIKQEVKAKVLAQANLLLCSACCCRFHRSAIWFVRPNLLTWDITGVSLFFYFETGNYYNPLKTHCFSSTGMIERREDPRPPPPPPACMSPSCVLRAPTVAAGCPPSPTPISRPLILWSAFANSGSFFCC